MSGKFPTPHTSITACRVCRCGIESKEPDNELAVVACGPVLVLFPFFDGRVGDRKPKYLSKLGHGKVHINPLLP